jgi:hypothetical protein
MMLLLTIRHKSGQDASKRPTADSESLAKVLVSQQDFTSQSGLCSRSISGQESGYERGD